MCRKGIAVSGHISRLLASGLAGTLLASYACAQVTAASGVYSVEGATLIPMTSETVLTDHTIVVRDGRIAAICPSEEDCSPRDAIVIDASGKYLMPALADMHNHFGGIPFDGRFETRVRMRNQNLRQYVMFGVTTVRDPAGNPGTLEMRDKINRGELFGPVVYASWGVMDGDPPLFPGPPSFPDPEGAADFVRLTKANGYDLVKVYSTMTQPVFDAVMAAADEVGLTVAAHVPIPVPLDHALEKGLRSIEHLTGYDVACAHPDHVMQPVAQDIYQGWAWCTPEKVKALAELTAKYDVWNVPTIALWDDTVTEFDRPLRDAGEKGKWEHPITFIGIDWLYTIYNPHDRAGITGTRSVRLGLVKALVDAGAPVLIGTDISATGYTVHQELGLFVEAGLTPYQALTAATSEPARYLQKEGEFGVLTVGARGDLLLLDENPLDDIRNTLTIRGVLVHGDWWDRDRIDAELDALQQEYAEDAALIEQLGVDRIREIMMGRTPAQE